MGIGKSFEELMSKIGYRFKDISHIQNALTHSSYSNEYKCKGMTIPSNERLEFLGDAILEMVVSEYLYENYKSLSEGKLTRIRQQLVCEKTLAGVAKRLLLGEYIHLGKGEENECRNSPKVLADTVEALIAAVYLDSKENGSFDDCKKVIIGLISDEFSNVCSVGAPDYKTMLQQFIEKDGSATLEYEVTKEEGPEHKKKFTVIAKVNNNVAGEGCASSKKNAEMKAAKRALELFGFKF